MFFFIVYYPRTTVYNAITTKSVCIYGCCHPSFIFYFVVKLAKLYFKTGNESYNQSYAIKHSVHSLLYEIFKKTYY